MTNTKQQINNMYIGLVFTYWAEKDTKLGTAKQKALMQMQSFSKTIDEKNPISREVLNNVRQMTASVSKQIMTDKSSEMVLDKSHAPQYKDFGMNQVTKSKQVLNQMIKSAQKDFSMEVKQNAAQYRPSNTNVAARAPQKMNQDTMMRILLQRQMHLEK